jgi:ATP-binding cassette subfamily F protein 3
MIRLRRITLSRGSAPLLQQAEASIAPGERIALIGPNGCGKSTLLGAIAGDVTLDEGDIEQPAQRVVRLEQRVPGSDLPAWRFVEAADAELQRARERVAQASEDDGLALATAHEALDAAGDATAPSRVKELLAGLGFSEAESMRPVQALSGGWRMRLNLARALFVPSDLLLLDEPTNHLDLDAIVWFERWLLRYPGTVLVVSHDRDFLDRVAQATLSVENRQLVRYAGGYSACELQRAQRQAQQQRALVEQQAHVARLNAFIDRFRAQATKARQVQSRIKALEKLARIAPLRGTRAANFVLPDPGDSPDPLIVARELDAGYPQARVLRGVDLTIERGARIGLLGRNGAGKSTLVRTLVGELAALAGECRIARALRIGYFAQHGVEALREDDSPLAFFQRLSPQARESALRDELGRAGFSGDDALRPIGPMSGGEKARLLLASIIRGAPHLLVLDEPTNHLDAATRDALTDALADFPGALLLVSHDRYLLRASCDRFVLVHDGQAQPFDGDLDDYLAWLQRGPSTATASGQPDHGKRDAPRADRREERRIAASRRAQTAERLKPLIQAIGRIEQRLPAIEGRLLAIDHDLADPGAWDAPERMAALGRERATLVTERESLEARWLELAEQRERIETDETGATRGSTGGSFTIDAVK